MGADGLTDEYLRFVLGLVAVIAMIAVAVWIAKRLGLGTTQGFRSKGRRLSLLEVMPLDAKRKLILVRQDTTDHLLLLGANHEMVLASFPAPAPPPPPVEPQLDDRSRLPPFLSTGRES